MPAAIIPIISAIVGAAGVGTSIYSLANQPSAPKPTPAATPTAAQQTASAAQTRQNQEAALSQQFPGIQAATGGSLSPDAWLRLSELLSGQAGTPGIGASGQDLITKLLGAGGSGVNVTAGSGGTGTSGGLSTTSYG